MKDKIKQSYSVLLNKKTNIFIALAISIIIVLAVVLGGTLMHIISKQGKVIDSIYSAMLMIIDPGFLAVEQGFWMGTISLLIVIFGMIVFLGGSIGYVSNMMGNYMDNVKMGTRKIYLNQHMLILNWNSRAEEIFAEECYKGETKNILILVKENRDEISEKLKIKKAQLKKENDKDYKNVNVFVRKVDLFSKHDILEAGIKRAKTIILLDDENTFQQEEQTNSIIAIKMLMLISKMNLNKGQTIIVQASDEWTKNVITDIAKDSKEEIVPVATNEILGRILAQISIMPELNQVYGELMSHKGKEFYALKTPYKKENKYEAIKNFFSTHKHAIPLNLMEIDGENWLFVMGESLKSAQEKGENKFEKQSLNINQNQKQKPKHIILIGENSKQDHIYECFGQYAKEHGEKSITIHKIIKENQQNPTKNQTYIKEYKIENTKDKTGIINIINEILEKQTINSILILSNDMDETMEKDAKALIDLINVKTAMLNHKQKPEIVVEILDPHHLDIAKEYGVKSIVFSNQYVSRLITQFGDNKSLYTFFADLFSYDDNLEQIQKEHFKSKELYIRKVEEIFEQQLPTMTIRNLVANTYLSTEKSSPLIILGYINKEDKLRLFGKNMEQQITLNQEDKLIIYSRH